ncbi:high-affinity choline transporter 1-like [Haemaphysalis longicornis]
MAFRLGLGCLWEGTGDGGCVVLGWLFCFLSHFLGDSFHIVVGGGGLTRDGGVGGDSLFLAARMPPAWEEDYGVIVSSAMALDTFEALYVTIYYVTILFIGVWAGRRLHLLHHPDGAPSTPGPTTDGLLFLKRYLLYNRSLPIMLAIGSMTATWVGGGYLNGSAEAIYTGGLVHCQAPLGYALSLVLGGLLFAPKIRATNALTMLDPFEWRYGRFVSLMLMVPAICSEVMWSASVLAAFGSAARVIVEVDVRMAILFCAAVTLVYTSLGGLYSVATTDVFQVSIMTVGLCSRDFTVAGYPGPYRLSPENQHEVLPYSIRYLTPHRVSLLGLAAISGAAMSSVDSSALSMASLLGRNLYLSMRRPTAGSGEMAAVVRITVFVVVLVSTAMALSVRSVYSLWNLSSDLAYVLLFPQLVCLFFLTEHTNTYGVLAGW